AHPIAPLIETPWTRLLPEARYKNKDDGLGEKPNGEWTALFPHPIKTGRPNSLGRVHHTPVADAYLGQLALAAVEAMKLGQGDGTDLLGVSFSATDLVGHVFGPRSHEVQDTLLRLDRVLGEFLTALDRLVGKDHYVVA